MATSPALVTLDRIIFEPRGEPSPDTPMSELDPTLRDMIVRAGARQEAILMRLTAIEERFDDSAERARATRAVVESRLSKIERAIARAEGMSSGAKVAIVVVWTAATSGIGFALSVLLG